MIGPIADSYDVIGNQCGKWGVIFMTVINAREEENKSSFFKMRSSLTCFLRGNEFFSSPQAVPIYDVETRLAKCLITSF